MVKLNIYRNVEIIMLCIAKKKKKEKKLFNIQMHVIQMFIFYHLYALGLFDALGKTVKQNYSTSQYFDWNTLTICEKRVRLYGEYVKKINICTVL